MRAEGRKKIFFSSFFFFFNGSQSEKKKNKVKSIAESLIQGFEPQGKKRGCTQKKRGNLAILETNTASCQMCHVGQGSEYHVTEHM